MTEVGTESGTADHETITTEGDEAITITSVAGKLETHEAGTATGDDQVDGTVTTDGTKTNEEVGTVTIAELGTETATDDGTESGTLVH
jgi:hypothetical protein